jgi:SAM-dependent methyltransferase
MNATQRFSDRVENYVRYRPGYPSETLALLREHANLRPEPVVADIGSGTGISTKLFLEHGNMVYGVEPNREMREAAEKLLGGYPRFRSVDGSAEHTTLANKSVDLIVAGQAFHWFDRKKSKREFARILRPSGSVALLWNTRRADTPFAKAHENLLQEFGADYHEINHTNIDAETIRKFFEPAAVHVHRLKNEQLLDFDGLRGRILSCSYIPSAGQPRHEEMLAAITRLFDDHKQNGVVRIDYDTEIYLGQLG